MPPGPSVDVAIIGGGIVGTSAAAMLAREGRRVVLYERAEIAAGASGRNSGAVQHPYDPVLAGLYLESVQLYRRLSEEPDLAFRLPDEPAGMLLVAFDDALTRDLARSLARSHPHLEPRHIESGELRRLEPALAPGVSACRLAIGYPVPPATATTSFAELARRHGARIEVGVSATPWIEDGRCRGVLAAGARVAADSVLVAAGPWTPDVLDPTGRWRPIRPLYGVVVETRLSRQPGHILEEADASEVIEPPVVELAIEAAAMERATVGSPHGATAFSFSLITAQGASTLGSTFIDREPDPVTLVSAIRERGAGFVPELHEAPVLGLRACARPLSADGRPLVGRVPGVEGCFVAAGHGPWGISTGPASARMVVDLILGRDVEIPPALEAGRFGPPRPAGTAPVPFAG